MKKSFYLSFRKTESGGMPPGGRGAAVHAARDARIRSKGWKDLCCLSTLVAGCWALLKSTGQWFLEKTRPNSAFLLSRPGTVAKRIFPSFALPANPSPLPRVWLASFIALLFSLNAFHANGQCPEGWQSYNTVGNAVGWYYNNGGGIDGIQPSSLTGAIQVKNRDLLVRPTNAAVIDHVGDTIILNMGELVTAGSTMTFTFGQAFSDGTARVKVEYSTDLVNWTVGWYYSNFNASDAFYSTFASREAHIFNGTVPSGGLRYLRFTRLGGRCYVGPVEYKSICRPVNCTTGITPAESVVAAGTTANVSNASSVLEFTYSEGQQLYTTTTIQAGAAQMPSGASGTSQITVDLGKTVDSTRMIMISLSGWKSGGIRQMEVYTSTDGTNFTFLSSIGEGEQDNRNALYADVQYLDGTYDAAETYNLYAIPIPTSGARFVRLKEMGTGAGIQAYVDGIGYGCGVFDFGDAPDTESGNSTNDYSTRITENGARHLRARPQWYSGNQFGSLLHLNTPPGRSLDASTGSSATQDAFETFVAPALPLCGAYTIPSSSIAITNKTGSTVTLHAWLDLNGNGVFEASEYASTTHNGTSFAGNLVWPNAEARTAERVFLRMRVTSADLVDDAATANVDERSIGLAPNGEVEDYFVPQSFFALQGVSVGECRNDEETGNVSKVLVAILMDWQNLPSGASLEVNVDGQIKTINPILAGQPRYVQYILNPDGGTKSALVRLVVPGCSPREFSTTLTLPQPCPLPECGGNGVIGGKVFIDYNANGNQDGAEPGFRGIPVKIYDDANNLLGEAVSEIQGLWVARGLPHGQRVRVEFVFPSDYVSGGVGTGDLSSVQFDTVGKCNVNVGVYRPGDFTEDDPWMITTCFTKGDPIASNSSDPTLVANRFLTPSGLSTANRYLAKAKETGTLWGVAFQASTKYLYSSSFLRRHAGLGPAGLGGLYKTDLTSFIQTGTQTAGTQVLLNLDDYGIATGDEISLNRVLGTNPKVPSYDALAYDKVGKWGLGDIDFNLTKDTLWVVNLHNRSLVWVKLDSSAVNSVGEITLPNPCSDAGDWRPFGLKSREDKIFVGGVCSAESTQDPSDLKAYVFSYTPGTATWKEEFSIKDMTYRMGGTWYDDERSSYWQPWSPDYKKLLTFGTGFWRYGPVPMLSDIEFDPEGNMIIAFADRTGYQLGSADYLPDESLTSVHSAMAGGDVVYAYHNNGTYLIENNATVGFRTSLGAGNNEGIGGGEYFYKDNYSFYHPETALGALTAHPITGDVVMTVIDATTVFTNGWLRNSLKTGNTLARYDVFKGNGIGKAAGLGDLELLLGSTLPDGLPLNVGNYVWFDLDQDGIQDPSEPPVAGLKVSLFRKDGVLVKDTVTNASGYYLFRNLQPNKDYIIVFGDMATMIKPGSFVINTPLFADSLWGATLANTTEAIATDENDSDGSVLSTGIPVALQGKIGVCFTTGEPGVNDYSFDLGIVPYSAIEIGDTVWVDANKNGIQDPGESPVAGLPVVLYMKSPAMALDTVYTDANGKYLFRSLEPNKDYVIVFGFSSNYNGAGNVVINGVEYVSTTANAGSDDANDSDAQKGSAVGGLASVFANVSVICLTTGDEGENNYTYDFGLTVEGIGNLVWKDLNLNGLKDPEEAGLAGVKVNLHTCADSVAIVKTVVSDAFGGYMLQGVSTGSYRLSFDFGMLEDKDTLRFTMPNVESDGLDLLDSDVLRPLPDGLDEDEVAYTACFNYTANALDNTRDAGIFCEDILIDPTGYLYCENNGEILEGGKILVSGPGNVYMIHDGSNGYYQFFVDKTGQYGISFINPMGYDTSTVCLAVDTALNAPVVIVYNAEYSLGSGDNNGDDYLDDYRCSINPFYKKMILEPGDFITNNNFPFNCLDYGDLPDNSVTGGYTYPTTLAANGGRHPILQDPALYMGSTVDIELNGQPEAMAGMMTGGDDAASVNQPDDEDGLMYEPVFIPGLKTDVFVRVTNTSGKTAKLWVFVDFNKDSDFNDSGETQVADVQNGYSGPVKVTFMVPQNAVTDMKLGLRLRLSTDGFLRATGVATDGEIEDYMVTIRGSNFVGNYVWHDLDQDGIQDDSEPGIPNVPVLLYVKGSLSLAVDTAVTDLSGKYYFFDLQPNTSYVAIFGLDSNFTSASKDTFTVNGIEYLLTLQDAGSDDALDSDADDNVAGVPAGCLAICFNTPPQNTFNITYDMGLYAPGIGNLVWKDDNFDGVQDANEVGIAGVKVVLHECVAGVPGPAIAGSMVVTDINGNYFIQGVGTGNYALSFDFSMLPNADTLRFTLPNVTLATSADAVDSDVLVPLDGYAGNTAIMKDTTACFAFNPTTLGVDNTRDAGLMCEDILIDPTGWLYCENSGEILKGGKITVEGPGNVYMIHDGSTGYYQFFVDAVGEYKIRVQNPAGFDTSRICLDRGYLDAPDSLALANPYIVGSEDANGDGYLDDYTCSKNRFYTRMLLEPGDFIVNNNFPFSCLDLGDLSNSFATLLASDGARHIVPQVPILFMGTTVDREYDGTVDNTGMAGMMSGGDDGDEVLDDEDGLCFPVALIPGQASTLEVQVTNNGITDAKLFGFIDFNRDGNFTFATTESEGGFTYDVLNHDSSEMAMAVVPAGFTGKVTLTFNVPAGVPMGIKVGVRLRLSYEPILFGSGPADNGEIEDYAITTAGFDFGDLPDSYNTAGGDNPPRHEVNGNLKLGAIVDADLDGQPDSMAGMMAGAGDDGNIGLVTLGGAPGDDEDGIILATPMIPGNTACFIVSAMNMTTSAAVLQAWVDFNGNGTFESGEQLTTGSFSPTGAIVPVGGLNAAKLTFNVPANATFYQGNAMVRFRLSPAGGLAPDSQIGAVPIGEIEDYKFTLAKIGNLVFEDRDFDGTQDAGEPGIDGVGVMLTYAGPDGILGNGDDAMYQTTTGPASSQQTGEYYFCGLINGTYKVKFTTPVGMTPTRSNIGTQTNGGLTDSDGSVTGMDMSMAMETFTIASVTGLPTGENSTGDSGNPGIGTFPDAQTDETHDQGFGLLDYGDLPESGNGDAFNTSMAEGGAVHIILAGLKLGASIDGDRDGSGSADASGDDASNTGSADDEDGVVFATPLIPGSNATITVSAMNMTGANAVLQGWIDWNNNGVLDAGESLAFTNNGIVPNGGVTNAPFTFPVPSTAIFNDGMVFARFRLSPGGGLGPDGPDKYNPLATVPFGEVEDYKLNVAKIGNLVFEDRNFNGIQDAVEPGINGVSVTLTWAGPDGNVDATADNVTYPSVLTSSGTGQGEYYFCGLIAGNYKLVFLSPENMAPSRWNQGTAVDLDSDGSNTDCDYRMAMRTFTIVDPANLRLNERGKGDASPAKVGTFPDAHTDETYDQGFAYLDCGCASPTVSLDRNTGSFVLEADNVTTGPCAFYLKTRVMDSNPLNRDTIDCPGTYTYGLFDIFGKLYCTNEVTAVDNSGPNLIGVLSRCKASTTKVNGPNPRTALRPFPVDSVSQVWKDTFLAISVDRVFNVEASWQNMGYAWYAGEAQFRDACDENVYCDCRTDVRVTDQLTYYPCTDVKINQIWAKITRVFTATDCRGNETKVTQEIYFVRPPVKTLKQELALNNGPQGTLYGRNLMSYVKMGGDGKLEVTLDSVNCTAPTEQVMIDTFLNRYYIFNDSLNCDDNLRNDYSYFVESVRAGRSARLLECNYSFDLQQTASYPVCDGNGRKVEVVTSYFDWCTGVKQPLDTIVLKYMDNTAPRFTNHAKEQVVISTGPLDCTATFGIDRTSLLQFFGVDVQDNEGGCGIRDVSVKVESCVDSVASGIIVGNRTWRSPQYQTVLSGGRRLVLGVPVGMHRLIVDATDMCYGQKRDTFYFRVEDKIAPVVKCTDQLNVTLSNTMGGAYGQSFTQVGTGIYGYARVLASQINAGTSDNCGLDWVRVRRAIPANNDLGLKSYYESLRNDVRFIDVAPTGQINKGDGYDWNGNGIVDGFEERFHDTLLPVGSSTLTKAPFIMTPLLDWADFFCSDYDQNVMIELWAKDVTRTLTTCSGTTMTSGGNMNYCWMNVLIEDKVAPTFIRPWDVLATCQDRAWVDTLALALSVGTLQLEVDNLTGTITSRTAGSNHAALYNYIEQIILSKNQPSGSASKVNVANNKFTRLSGGDCGRIRLDVVVSRPSWHCDAGQYRLTYRPQKLVKDVWQTYDGATSWPNTLLGGGNVTTITVRPVHEYTMRFPADVTNATCANVTPAHKVENVVDGGELGCDVLAVLVQDKRYNGATKDGAPVAECYKVFRTFTVVNWCQYDESCGEPMNAATIVPRKAAGAVVGVRDADRDGSEEYLLDGNAWTGIPALNVPAACNTNTKGNNGNERFAWMYTQYLFVHDTEAPTLATTAPAGGWVGYQNKETCGGEIKLTFSSTDGCSATELQSGTSVAIERIWLNPNQNKNARVNVPNAQISPVLSTLDGDNKTTQPTQNWTFEVTNAMSQRALSHALVPGPHSLTVVVRDDCGNVSRELDIPFMIRDTNGTVPLCINGLSTNLMFNPQTGKNEVTIWATDFKAPSEVFDCNGQGTNGTTFDQNKKMITNANYFVYMDTDPVTAGFQNAAIGSNGRPNTANSYPTSITITCDQLASFTANPPSGTRAVLVRVYTRDNASRYAGNTDNWSWCETFVSVDNATVCSGGTNTTAAIAGAVVTEANVKVAGVEVQLSDRSAMRYATDKQGNFSFNGLEKWYDYTVTPQLDKDYLNGVSTFDLVLIAKHILGQAPLTSPYKLIAADVNNSKTITTLDLVQLRRLVLGIDSKLSSNTSWRFVDASHKFADPSNPWATQFPEVVNVNDLGVDVRANFIAIKVGDVNGNALGTSTVRTNGTFSLNAEDKSLKSGAEVRIPITASLAGMEGYQFTLGIDRDKAELVDIEYGVMQAEHFGIFAKEGLITASWDARKAAGAGETLFTLVLRAKAEVSSLEEVLNINSRITAAEAYTKGGEYQSVTLKLGGRTAQTGGPMLYQNIPNPFAGETVIGFHLVEAGEAVLTVSDIQGRVLRVIRGEYGAGYQQVRLRSDELPSGVLQYTLTSGDFTATRRMVVGK